ncbi:MAG: P-loop NTPase, partial [Coriobacteriia bacterium]|nr:P-loop NTPase [Coriobacteriia bacterium]
MSTPLAPPRPGRLTVAIASGKGGTGKTLVATSLALAASRGGTPAALVDCDADAPNDALFLAPASSDTAPVEVMLPVIDASSCVLCGACRDACAYGAVRVLGGQVMVFPVPPFPEAKTTCLIVHQPRRPERARSTTAR